MYPTKTKIYAYKAKEPIKLDGVFYCNTSYKNTHHLARIFVATDSNDGCVLGRHSAIKLGVMTLVEEVNMLRTGNNEINKMMNEFKKVFEGLGKLKDVQIKFDIDESVKPVTQHLRRIPFHVRKKVDKKIQELLQLDIIEKVRDSTSWISPVVAVPNFCCTQSM